MVMVQEAKCEQGLTTLGQLVQQEEAARNRQQRSVPGQDSQTSDVPQLLGIWGVEPHLWARVRHQGSLVVFRQGHRKAVMPIGHHGLMLGVIRPPCLVLHSRRGRQRVCLPVAIDKS